MKSIKWIVKIIGAGITAFVITSVLLIGYGFYLPHVSNPDGNTDFKWVGGSFFVNGYEGYGFGRFDSNGFNNPKYIENPDVVIVGSSHMEATHVRQNQTTASKLAKYLEESGKNYSVYNMGVAGHTFSKVCAYLPETFKQFSKPPKYLIIETENTTITPANADAIVNHKIDVQSSSSSKIVRFIQSIPTFRILYSQYKRGLADRFLPDSFFISSSSADEPNENNEQFLPGISYEKVMQYIASFEKTYGTTIIIFYHPTEVIGSDGAVSFPNKISTTPFSESAANNDIDFLNMKDSFVEMYNNEHKLPHGFITGEIGVGHLNSDGHDLIAKKLSEKIATIEGANND